MLKPACFVGGSASDVFKRVAFEEAVACGDCSEYFPFPRSVSVLMAQLYTPCAH